MILAQLRRRLWRSGALFAAILLATTGFTVLTGAVETSRLQVVEEVDANFRGAYDILVRPKGARTAIEDTRGLVAPNQLAGTYGGITTAQYQAVRAVPGVEVAAPIATLGSTVVWDSVPLDLTELVDRSKTRQLIRIETATTADRGLSHLPGATRYVYVTRQPVIGIDTKKTVGSRLYFQDGTVRNADERCMPSSALLEVQEDGRKQPICGTAMSGFYERYPGGHTPYFQTYRLLPDGRFTSDGAGAEYADERLIVKVSRITSVGLAAIDPEAEARLLRLDGAVTSGRYLKGDDTARPQGDTVALPSLVSTRPVRDESTSITVSRITDEIAAAVPGTRGPAMNALLDHAAGARLRALEAGPQPPRTDDPTGADRMLTLQFLLHSGPPSYAAGTGGTLRPATTQDVPDSWRGVQHGVDAQPLYLHEVPFRPTTSDGIWLIAARTVGEFDPDRVDGGSGSARVPLETYRTPEAAGADAASRELLGDRPLLPNGDPRGYLTTAPQIITTLAALPPLLGKERADKAVSAIRVRVSDVHTFDEVTRERIRRIAEEIGATTGLDVDIVVGSSLQPQTIELAAGALGRPELKLTELWSRKGVAVAVIQAIDRKSALLFGLILVVCALFLANATTAAVRDRRRELAVLACVGWPRHRLATLVAGEVTLVGLAAGAVSAGLAVPLGAVAGVPVRPAQALLAIPVALALTVLAAVLPAVQAARAHPGTALAPRVSPVRRAGRALPGQTVLASALRNSRRRPGRAVLAATAVALGVGAFTTLLLATWVFHGSITGSLLGDAVSLRVRAVDTVAVVATLVLAALALTDVLYLNVRERAGELAALQATGWSDAALTRLIAYEGLLVGCAGAVVGAGLGLLFVERLAGAVTAEAVLATVVAGLAGTVLSGLAAVLPALSTRRLRLARLLAQD